MSKEDDLDKLQVNVMEIHSDLCVLMELMLKVEPGDTAQADEIYQAFDNMVSIVTACRVHAQALLKAHHLHKEGNKQMKTAKTLTQQFFENELGMTMEGVEP